MPFTIHTEHDIQEQATVDDVIKAFGQGDIIITTKGKGKSKKTIEITMIARPFCPYTRISLGIIEACKYNIILQAKQRSDKRHKIVIDYLQTTSCTYPQIFHDGTAWGGSDTLSQHLNEM